MAFAEAEVPHGARFEYLETEFYEDDLVEDRNVRAHPPGESADTSSRACWNCGTVETHRTPPTRTREEAVEAAAGISVTLDEYGVEHDWLFLLGRVDELKRDPDYAGDDFATFERAVAEAIVAANPR